MKRRKGNWICDILPRNCLLKHRIEGKMEETIEVTRRRERRGKQLLYNLQGMRGYWKLQEEALGGFLWRTRSGRV